jgi:hypothetical protein
MIVTSSFAGNGDRAGNGGDAIVCYKQKVTKENLSYLSPISTKVKDYWEYSQMINNVSLNLGPSKDYKEKVLYVLNRLKKIDSFRANLLIKRFRSNRFYSLVGRGQIPVVDDSHSYLSPSGVDNCIEVQVAFQILNPRMFQSKVLIDKDIFNNMDENHKAGLILHELLYEHDIKYAKATDSDTIRWFNYVISSDIEGLFTDTHDGFSVKYLDMIRENKVDYFDYENNGAQKELYLNRKEETNISNNDLLPSNFTMISSDFIDDGTKVIKGKMQILAQGEDVFIDDLIATVESKELKYSIEDDKETLEGDLNISFNNQNISVTKMESIGKSTFGLYTHPFTYTDEELKVTDLSYLSIGKKITRFSDFKSIVIKKNKYSCLANCLVTKMEGRLDIFGEYKVLGKIVSFSDSGKFINLKNPLELEIKYGKKSKYKRIQKLELKNESFMAKVNIEKSKRKDVIISDGFRSFNIGKCRTDRCAISLEMGDFKLLNAQEAL